jgi:hypothetical protein
MSLMMTAPSSTGSRRTEEVIDLTSGDTTGLSGSHVGSCYRALSYCAGQFGRT